MRLRTTPLFLLGLLVAACSGDTAETASETEEFEAPAAAADASADEAALRAKLDYLVEHYNMHHASMVADLYSDSAFRLMANGAVDMGKEVILASLEASMAGSPVLTASTADVLVIGDYAISRGPYAVQTTPEGGETVSISGNFMTWATRDGADWKLAWVTTNYDSPRPELPREAYEGDAPPLDGTMTDLIEGYVAHWNLGHADMVAELYTDDAVSAFANLPVAEGNTAIEAALAERMEQGPSEIAIFDVGTTDLGEGWALDGGYYEITAEDGGQTGSYMILCRQQDDGSWKIHWAISNGFADAM